jgi:YD repeat-containing protein
VFTEDELDLRSPAGTTGLDYGRWYNSSDSRVGSHGIGWFGSFNETLKPDGAGDIDFEEPGGRISTFTSDGTGGLKHPTGVEATVLTRVDGSLALAFADGAVWEFDLAGRVESRTLWDGQTITITRNANGAPTLVTSSTGPTLTFTYSTVAGAQRLATVIGSWGETATFTYGATTAFLASATLPGNLVTSYTTDGTGRVTKITDPSGVAKVDNIYDSFNRVISQTAPSGAVTTFSYDTASLSTTVHDPVTNTDVVYHHDSNARVIAITDPFGKGVTRAYDPQNNVTSGQDRLGAQIVETFDSNSNVLTWDCPEIS